MAAGTDIAVVNYRLEPGLITFTHTEVPRLCGARASARGSSAARSKPPAPAGSRSARCSFVSAYIAGIPSSTICYHKRWPKPSPRTSGSNQANAPISAAAIRPISRRCPTARPPKSRASKDGAAIDKLQDRLYAEGKRALLVVLQGTDTAGKDGTIRHVFKETGPLGVSVTAFKRPSEEELAHDFLWRAHLAAPRRGFIGIFNRSHYEDVLIVKVRKLAPARRRSSGATTRSTTSRRC